MPVTVTDPNAPRGNGGSATTGTEPPEKRFSLHQRRGVLDGIGFDVSVPAFAAFMVLHGKPARSVKLADSATKADLLALQKQLAHALGQVARMADMLGDWNPGAAVDGEMGDPVLTVGELRRREDNEPS